MTYSSDNPPKRGNAKKAFDYFRRKFPSRRIRELSYSPSCHGVRAWVCELEMKPTDIMHFNFDKSCITHTVQCANLDLLSPY